MAGPEEEWRIQQRNRQFILEMRRCPHPIIALVHGSAYGAGLALALAADIRIGSSTAQMCCAFVNIGLGGCDIGVSYFLPRIVGASLASDLILTGRTINAEEAWAAGLFSRMVESDDALTAAGETVAEEMMRVAPMALRLSKEVLRFSLDAGSIEAVIAMEDRNQVLCARSQNYAEAVSAFQERRRPSWTTR